MSYHFVQALYNAIIGSSGYYDPDITSFIGEEGSPGLFAVVLGVREDLNQAAASLQEIEGHAPARGALLVEGESEKKFLINAGKSSQFTWFDGLDPLVYGGDGFKKPTHLKHLHAWLDRQGYDVYIQGDEDGKGNDPFHQLVNQGIVEEHHTFSFDRDFESSMPAWLFIEALLKLGLAKETHIDDLRRQLDASQESFVATATRICGEDVGERKVEIARTAGQLFGETNAWTDDEYEASELHDFVKFVAQMPT